MSDRARTCTRRVLAFGAAWSLSLSILVCGAATADVEMPRLYPDGEYTVEVLQKAMPSIGAAPGVTMQLVAGNMTNNGLPMQVHQFISERPVEEIVAMYQTRFEQLGMLGPRIEVSGDFASLYGGLGPYFVRMQMAQDSGQTTGYVSVMAQPGTVEPTRDSDFPLPASLTIESRMVFRDAGDEMETLIAHSNDFPGTVLDDLVRHLSAEGWREVESGGRGAGRDIGGLRFTQGNDRAEILVSGGRDGAYRSAVVVNWSKR